MKKIEHTLSEIFSEGFDILAEGFPARLNGARAGSMEDFMLAGLPSSLDERFLQSDIRALFAADEREIYFTPPPHSESAFEELPETNSIVLENGFFAGGNGAVDLANGVFCGSLREAFSLFDGEKLAGLLAAYNSVADNKNDALTALNSAFMQDGALVWVPAGVNLTKPLLIDNRFASDEEAQMCFGRTLVVLGEGAEADISILYRVSGKTRFLIDHVREIVVGKGARLHLSEASLIGGGSSILLNSYLRQAEGSRTKSVCASLGAGFSRLSLHSELSGEGSGHAEADLHGLYIASGQAHNDIELNLKHLSPDCRSRQLVKGIAADDATGVFSGMIYVARDAQRTDAAQHNRNLQLTDTAHVFTRPQLEIYADDVKCGHGATVGRLDEDAVYYMRQRGVGEAEARRMQMQGFAGDIINHCSSEVFRDFVAAKTDELISGF